MSNLLPTFRELYLSLGPWRTTRTQRQALLRLIAVALEEGVPLGPLLDRWARDERGGQRRRVRRLADLVQAGTALPDAIEQVDGVLGEEEALAIRFDAQSGTRTAAIQAALEDRDGTELTVRRETGNALAYFVFVTLVGGVIVTFINVKIVPVFQRLTADLGASDSPALDWSWWAFQAVTNSWWLLLPAGVGLLWLLFSSTGRRIWRDIPPIAAWSPWRAHYVADMLRKLGVAAAAGRPLSGAVSTLARYHFDPRIRHRLLYVRNEVEQGVNIWQASRAAGLLTDVEAELLNTAERVGNRAWVLEELARTRYRRATRRWSRRSVWLVPLLALVLGAFVLVQALAVFQPLSHFLQIR